MVKLTKCMSCRWMHYVLGPLLIAYQVCQAQLIVIMLPANKASGTPFLKKGMHTHTHIHTHTHTHTHTRKVPHCLNKVTLPGKSRMPVH